MNDFFATWKGLQEQMLAAQKAQLEAATKMMGMGESFNGALEAAQKIAEQNTKAWESWIGLWTGKK